VVVAQGKLPDNSRMREVIRSALVSVAPETLFGLIADVERYPEFVPGCRFAAIESQDGAEVVATLGVERGPLNTRFTTRNTLEPPERLRMKLERGPFSTLEGVWEVRPVGASGSEVTLTLRFEFANRLAGMMLTPIFEETAKSLVDAFVARARSMATR
jgi:ribosome-associated toxin RatA of RatAB toxin-antitoxin module